MNWLKTGIGLKFWMRAAAGFPFNKRGPLVIFGFGDENEGV